MYGPLGIDKVLALFSEALNCEAKLVYQAIWDKNETDLSLKIKSFDIASQIRMLFHVCASSLTSCVHRYTPFIVDYIKCLYPESGMRMELQNYLAVFPFLPQYYPEELKRILLRYLSYPELELIPRGTAAALGQFGLCPRPVLPPPVSDVIKPLTDASPDLMPENYLKRRTSG